MIELETTEAATTSWTIRRWWVGVIVLVTAGALVRFSGLTTRELWVDESCTFYVVDHLFHFPPTGPDPRGELAHIPYFTLLWGWTRLTGETAWGLRAFSVLAGCMGILILGLATRRIGGPRVGLIAVSLAVLHPLHIHYSREARVYALWMLAITGCTYLLYQAATKLRWRWWVAFGGLTWLSVLTHYYTIFWLPGTLAAIILTRQRKRFFWQWSVAVAGLAMALVPILWGLTLQWGGGGPRPWLRETWLGYPPVLAIPKSLWSMLPSGGYPSYLGALTASLQALSAQVGSWVRIAVPWAAVGGIGMLVIALFVRRAQRHHQGTAGKNRQPPFGMVGVSFHYRTMIWLVLLSLLFLGTAFFYSLLVEPVYVVGRYDTAAWPAITIAIALLIDVVARTCVRRRARQSFVALVLTGGLLACSAAADIGMYLVPVENPTTRRARRIGALVGNDDLVISVGMYRWFMSYEWNRLGFAPEILSFPRAHDRQLCWDDPEAEQADPGRLDRDAKEIILEVSRAFGRRRRVWLLAQGDPSGSRWKVDRMLFTRMHERGITVWPHDDWTGLAELKDTNEP